MEHTHKMFLVDKHQLERLTPTQSEDWDIRKVETKRLDSEMRDVLNRTDLTDHDKATLYSNILHKFLNHTRQAETEKSKLTLIMPPSDPGDVKHPTAADFVVSEVVNALSDSHRPRGRMLLRTMEGQKDVASWNERGEFLYKGNVVVGSNMYELVKAVTGKQNITQANVPNGWDEFTKAMAELNIPGSVVGNAKQRRYIENLKFTTPSATPQSSPPVTPPPTPRPTGYQLWRDKGFTTSKPTTSISFDDARSFNTKQAYKMTKKEIDESWLRY